MSLDGERPRRACGYGHSRTSRFGRCRRSSHAHRARCASRRSRDSEGAAAPRQGHRELHGRGAHDKRAKGDRRSRSRSAGDGDGGDRQSADPRCESLAAEVKKQRRSAMSEGLNRFVPAIRTRHLAAAVALRREQRAKGRVGGAWRFRRLAVVPSRLLTRLMVAGRRSRCGSGGGLEVQPDRERCGAFGVDVVVSDSGPVRASR